MTLFLGVLLTPYLKIEIHIRLFFVVSGFDFDKLVLEGFLVEFRLFVLSLVFPSGDIHVIGVIPLGLTFLCLAFNAEMTAAGLVPVEGVTGHQLSDLEEVLKPQRFLKFLVELVLLARHTNALIELFLEFLDFSDCLLQAFLTTGHTDIFPHYVAKFLVEHVDPSIMGGIVLEGQGKRFDASVSAQLTAIHRELVRKRSQGGA